jgi:formate hydrogenlyase transcriptional activator
MDMLTQYDWPGNVRELENLIQRAVILSPDTELCISGSELCCMPAQQTHAGSVLEVAERDYIVRTLKETQWKVGGRNGAAARLGVKRTTLQHKIQKYGIGRPS